MSIYLKIADEKILSIEEFIKDIQQNKWKHYIYQQVIENPNLPGLVLAGGLFTFDSIKFDTWNGRDMAICLYNKNENWLFNKQIVGIGCDNNQIAYVHKYYTKKQFHLIKTSYTVHFVNTDITVSFEAINE